MSNVKLERLNDLLQKEISKILMTEIRDPEIHFVTITGVNTTSDYSFSKVYYTVLEEDKKKEIHEKLRKAAGFIRTKLCDVIEIRHMPELKFIYDRSIAYGNHIDEIIKSIHEKEEK